MNERLILPPHYRIPDFQTPLVFLAGPIQGANDWQTPTAEYLLERHRKMLVASPRRLSEEGFDYEEQISWEKNHLKLARQFGVIAFWFAAQDPSVPHREGRAYAQTSRIEIGRVTGWLDDDTFGFPFVIGIDPKYGEQGGGSERYFRSLANEHEIKVADSLDETIEQIEYHLGEL